MDEDECESVLKLVDAHETSWN